MAKSKKRKSYEKEYGKYIGAALFTTHVGVMNAHQHGDAVDQAEAHAVHDLLKNAFPKLPTTGP